LTQEQEDALRAKILGSMRPVEFSLQLEGLREDVDNLVLHLEDVDRRLAEIEASLATLQNQVAKLGGEIHLLEEKVKAGDKKLETKLNVLREEMNGKFVEIFALIKELQRNALTVPTLQRPLRIKPEVRLVTIGRARHLCSGSANDVEVGDQAQRPVAYVLILEALHHAPP
jgi:chromosome segregation ATPase